MKHSWLRDWCRKLAPVNSYNTNPDAVAGNKPTTTDNLPQTFGDKRAVAALAGGMSTRWVDGEMQKGMPFLRLGARRCRFDLAEVAEWLREKYRVQRLPVARKEAA